MTALPYPYNAVGLIGLPFIFIALRELHAIISILAAQSLNFGERYWSEVSGTNNTSIIAGDATTVTVYQQPASDEH